MGTESGGTMNGGTESNAKRVRLYPPNFKGPYTVYIRAQEGKSINRLSIWNILIKKFKTAVEVKKMFSDKVRVIFSDINEANSCVQDKDFSAFRVYIQANIVEVDGVVIMDLDENEKMLEMGVGKLEKSSETNIKILEVYRMKRKSIRESVVSTMTESGPEVHVENKIEWVPAKAVRVTFQGSILPDFIKVYGVVVQVLAFNPKVMYCEKCLRYGHTKAYCNNKHRCQKCGLVHDLNAVCEVSEFSCPNCKKKFSTKDHKCEAREVFVDSLIKKAQTRHNLSYAGVVRGDQGVKRQRKDDNIYEILSELDTDVDLCSDSDFPEVSETLEKRNKVRKAKSAFEKARLTQKQYHRNKIADKESENVESQNKISESEEGVSGESGTNDKLPEKGKNLGHASWDFSSWQSIIRVFLVKIGVTQEILKFINTWIFPFVETIVIPKVVPMLSQILSQI